MKLKQVCCLYQAVTLFMCLYFAHPTQACLPNPTNYIHAVSQTVSDKANIAPVDKHDPSLQTEQHKLLAPVIFFIIILAVAAYIVYQLVKLLDKVIPPEKKPDPPPNSGNTNYPPIVINPSVGPEPAIVGKRYTGPMLTLTNTTGCTVTNYNIVTYSWANTWEKSTNLLFDHYWAVSTQTSTNMQVWEDTHYQVECFYTAGVGVLYRYRHYGTNFYQCYYSSEHFRTNPIAPAYFNLTDRPYQPQQYFKLNSQ